MPLLPSVSWHARAREVTSEPVSERPSGGAKSGLAVALGHVVVPTGLAPDD